MAEGSRNPLNVFNHDFPTDSDHALLTVASEFSAFAMTFKLKRDQPLKKVKAKFGSCVDWHSKDLIYVFQGRVVQDEATSEQLSMSPQGNTIEASAQQKFDGACSELRQQEMADSGMELLCVTNAEDCVVLTVRSLDGFGKKYRIRKDCDLGNVMRDFERLSGQKSLRFVFDGTRINTWETPSKLEMQDGDIIEAHREVFGG